MSFLKKYFEKNKNMDKWNNRAIAFYAALDNISQVCPEVSKNIFKELCDQRSFLKLIASENFSSLETQFAMGNLLTDKYSEGVAGKRFYAGCDNVDAIESIAQKRAEELFDAEHAYVQPHSGADANMVALWAIIIHKIQNKRMMELEKKSIDELTDKEYEELRKVLVNQKLMGMSLHSGGHLTHGYRHNVSSKMMQSVSYGVDEKTGLLDYAKIAEIAKKEKPLILIAGYSAYPRKIDFEKMREIADSVDATLMVDMAHFAGLVAGGVFKGKYNPVKYAHVITSTTHKTLRGPRGGLILCKEEYRDVVDKGCPFVLGGPMPHVIAAKAVAFKEAMTKEYKTYAENIVKNAKYLAEELKNFGCSLVTDGTDNHLMLLDVNKSFNLNGRQAENALREAHLTLNRNALHDDKNGPWYTSGLRLGTPAVTTLGMGKNEMREIANIIFDVLSHTKPKFLEKKNVYSKAKVEVDKNILKSSINRVSKLLDEHKLYPELSIENF